MYFDGLVIGAWYRSDEWDETPCKCLQMSEKEALVMSPPAHSTFLNSEGRLDSSMASDCEWREGCCVAGEESAECGSCMSGTAAMSTAASAPGSGDNALAQADVSATDLSPQQLEAGVSETNDCTAHDTYISCVSINDLPDEMLIKIFSHMSFSELLDVQKVNSRWERVSKEAELWADKEYEIRRYTMHDTHACRGDYTDQDAIQTLCSTPNLRKVCLYRAAESSVFRTLYNRCHGLTELRLHYTQELSYSVLKNLVEKCPKIHTLQISRELLNSENAPTALSQLQHLRVLQVVGRFMSEVVLLRSLADGCPQLSEVDFGSLLADVDDLRYFLDAKRNTLKSLCTKWTMVGKQCVTPLLTVCADTLERLVLYGYDVVLDEAREAFTALGTLKNLKELKLAIGDPLPPPGTALLAFNSGGFPKLKLLDMRDSFGLTNEVLIVICYACPALRELVVRSCDLLSDAGFSQIHRLKNLEILDVSGCSGLRGAVIPRLSRLPQLHLLRVEKMVFQNLQPGLSSIINLSGLRCLRLDSSDVTGMPFDQFPGKLINLRDLHVPWCGGDSKTIEACGMLTEQMPNLNIHGIIKEGPVDNAEGYGTEDDDMEEENEEQVGHEDGGDNAEQQN